MKNTSANQKTQQENAMENQKSHSQIGKQSKHTTTNKKAKMANQKNTMTNMKTQPQIRKHNDKS